MMSLEFAKQRREGLLREAELSHRTKALVATGKRRVGRRSALAQEMKRLVGRFLKFLSASNVIVARALVTREEKRREREHQDSTRHSRGPRRRTHLPGADHRPFHRVCTRDRGSREGCRRVRLLFPIDPEAFFVSAGSGTREAA